MAADAGEVTDYISGLLLRYFKPAINAGISKPKLTFERDRDLLLLYWSISPTVRTLCTYVITHRHETASFLTARRRFDNATIRGRIDARATVTERLVSGDPARHVFHEPVRSVSTGPNYVLAWVIRQAIQVSDSFLGMLPLTASYRSHVETSVSDLGAVKRIDALRAILGEIHVSRRPSAQALREAARSRKQTYVLAYRAYQELTAIEAGDAAAIQRLLSATLLAPAETWRRFELAVGLAIATALETVLSIPLELSLLAADTGHPIATVGRLAVFWQAKTDYHVYPILEPSENVAKDMLAQYGMKYDSDRPDLVVVDTDAAQVVAVVEAKFFTVEGEDARDRLREALHQVVRYARAYRIDMVDVRALLSASVIALANKPILPDDDGMIAPVVIGFDDILSPQRLVAWAEQWQEPSLRQAPLLPPAPSRPPSSLT